MMIFFVLKALRKERERENDEKMHGNFKLVTPKNNNNLISCIQNFFTIEKNLH